MSDSPRRSQNSRQDGVRTTLRYGVVAEGGQPKAPSASSRPPPEPSQLPGAELLYLLRSLSDDARTVLAIGLGEALRLGTPWLGVEFLIMGLVRHPQELLAGYFRHIRMDPGVIRGALRGLLPIQNKNWRRISNVQRLGSKTLPELQEVDREVMAVLWGSDAMPRAVLTPRLRLVLRKAVSLAKGDKVGPDHLLRALVEQRRSPSVELLLGMVEPDASKPPTHLVNWIERWREDPEALKALVAEAIPNPGRTEHATEPPPPSSEAAPDPLYRPPSPEVDQKNRPDPGQLGRDLTEAALRGELGPAVGKSAGAAMVQLGSILLQARAHNPLLIGDPGVGKTAIVEGFAWRLAAGHEHGQPVAPQLADWRVRELRSDALLRAACSSMSDAWIQDLIDELATGPGRAVVFIDDVHELLESGDGDRSAVAALLEALLSRSEISCVCTATVAGYHQQIAPDQSLSQHLSPLWISEPPPQEAIAIARAVAQGSLEPRHDVTYPPEVAEEAVRLALRYLHDELLPGKAIRLLDQAGTSVLLNGTLGGGQGSSGRVTVESLREIVSDRSGVPLTRLREDEGQRLLRVEADLRRSLAEQAEAVEQVLRVLRRSRAGLADPRRPLGVFLFAGQPGLGQLDLAMDLAESLFDEKEAYLHVSLSEYRELSRLPALLGALPGGGEVRGEGRLTAWLRRRPFSVVVLDEIERAHPEAQHLLLRLFDSGTLTDARGSSVDARNAIFIMTTALGLTEEAGSEPAAARHRVAAAVEAELAPELLDRIDRVVCFAPVDEGSLQEVLEAKLDEIARRLRRSRGIALRATEGFKWEICHRFAEAPRRVSRLRRALEEAIEARLTAPILAGELGQGAEVVLDINDLPPTDEGVRP